MITNISTSTRTRGAGNTSARGQNPSHQSLMTRGAPPLEKSPTNAAGSTIRGLRPLVDPRTQNTRVEGSQNTRRSQRRDAITR